MIVHNSTFIQPLGTFVHEYGYLSPHLCIVNEATFSFSANAQQMTEKGHMHKGDHMHKAAQTVSLEQTPGVFTQESVTLAPGDYQFAIANKGVDHEVGFVLVPKGKYDAANHIKAAYVSAPVATNTTGKTSVVTLAKGEYEYFCPLNPTAKYPLTVTDVNSISLTQTPGEFTQKSVTVAPGSYQFDIVNDGVDHEVGFVLVPKGKYDAANHIKAAYVSAPVATNTTGKTSVVTLEKGEYEYFCPLNPTAKNSLTVVDVKNVSLTQVPGEFTEKRITLAPGSYQFDIINKGVDHEVGFVLAPKGKTDAANHIKAAYVTAPVATNTTGKTSVVTLEKGEYVYFCPLNPTKQNTLIVK